MAHILYSNHLCLLPCSRNDLDALHALWTEAGVRHFLFDDRLICREEALSFIDASMAAFAEYGYGLWLCYAQTCHVIAGFAGLLYTEQEPPRLIYGTRPQYWGRGYATEAACTVLGYAWDMLGLRRVIADVDEPNTASVRVLEKLGMSLTRREVVNDRPLLYYEFGAGSTVGNLQPY